MNWMPMKMSSTARSSSGRLARATPVQLALHGQHQGDEHAEQEETTPTVPNTCSGRVA